MVFEEHNGSLKSEVWNRFLLDKATVGAKCKLCGKALKVRGSSTSGLARHFETFHRSAQDTNQVVKRHKIDIPLYFQSKKPALDEELSRLCVKDRLDFNQISTSRGIKNCRSIMQMQLKKSFRALGYEIPKSHSGVGACPFYSMKWPKQS